jgi:Ca2+:H+ antiporter
MPRFRETGDDLHLPAALPGATAAVAAEAHLVSGALETTAGGRGLTAFFLGVITLPLVGDAAEYFAAANFARRDRMGLVTSIAVGSGIEVALLAAPPLALAFFFVTPPGG